MDLQPTPSVIHLIGGIPSQELEPPIWIDRPIIYKGSDVTITTVSLSPSLYEWAKQFLACVVEVKTPRSIVDIDYYTKLGVLDSLDDPIELGGLCIDIVVHPITEKLWLEVDYGYGIPITEESEVTILERHAYGLDYV